MESCCIHLIIYALNLREEKKKHGAHILCKKKNANVDARETREFFCRLPASDSFILYKNIHDLDESDEFEAKKKG